MKLVAFPLASRSPTRRRRCSHWTGSDSSTLEVSAETPVATTVFGTVRIEAGAFRILKAQPASPSTPKKRCKKGKHGKRVKEGHKKHPHKPTHRHRGR